MAGMNKEKYVEEPTKPKRRPRRMKSFSDALGSLGSSFQNIFDKNSQTQKKKGKELSKSVQSLNEPRENQELKTSIIGEYEKGKLQHSLSTDSGNLNHTSNGHAKHIEIDTPPPSPEEDEIELLKQKLMAMPNHNFPHGVKQKSTTLPLPRIEVEESPTPIQETTNQNRENHDHVDNGSHSPLVAPKQKRDRSASMVWVDFLTEEGVQVDGDPEFDIGSVNTNDLDDDCESEIRDGFGDEVKVGNKGRRPSELARRKLWFGLNTEPEPDDEDDVCSSIGENSRHSTKLSEKLRKDSIAIFAKGRGTPEPPKWKTDNSQHKNVDDLIFQQFAVHENNEEIVQIGNFLVALERTGLRRNDPRLAELFDNLKKAHVAQEVNHPQRAAGSIETLRLNRDDFKSVITDNIVLISKAFRQQFIIPEFPAFCAHIERMFNQCRNVKGGKVASYIPQLARVDPNFWGVSICTIDGQRFSIGDTQIPFTVQSCSKPLTYAIALNELGEETVHQYVGQEPSGRMFNELVLDHNKKPHNPMVNAGAIIVCSLLKSMVKPEMSLAEKFDYTQEYFKKICGNEYIGFNNAVFLSERDAADRNYALGFYMRENKCFPEGTNLKECMDYYFQICSMECNCEAMSVMAATLANGGICPVSGEKVLKSDSVRDVLSLMHSCGMYDYSGQFAFKVGLPAKSGVCGAIMIVVPNVLGMAVWSPPLDILGNTVRGVELCKELVQVFNFHKYDNLRHASHKLDPRRHRYETKGLNIVNLLFSAASGDVTSMRRHHLSGMDMNASDYDGRTALHLAAAEGHLECVVYLLRQCRVKHNPKDRWGHLPEDDSVKFGHEDVTEFLKTWTPDEGDVD